MREYYRWMMVIHASMAVLCACMTWQFWFETSGMVPKVSGGVILIVGGVFVRLAFAWAGLARRRAWR